MKRFIVAAALLVSAFAFAGENLNGVFPNGIPLNGVRMNGASAQRTTPAKVAPAPTGVRVQNAATRHGTLYVR